MNGNQRVVVYNNDHRTVAYRFAEGVVNTAQTEELKDKSTYSVGILSDKELISYSFDIQKGLTKQEMDDTVEIRMFQDAGLNHMIDYKIVYGVRDSLLDVKNLSVTAFAVVPTHFAASFDPIRSRCRYLDTILPFSTLPFGLYAADILEKKSDIFIYIRQKESTITFFYEGTFVYTKVLNMGLKGMYELFVKRDNEGIPYDAFVAAVTERGLDPTRYTGGAGESVHHQDLLHVFEKGFADANTVIGYARRMAGIQGFDRLFIGTEKGTVPAVCAVAKEATGIPGYDLEFFTDFYLKDDPYIDQNIILSLVEAQNAAKGLETNPFNLTLYPRPKKFIHRESGRFVTLTAVGVAAALLYPAYLAVDTRWQSYTYAATLGRLQITQGEFLELKAQEDEIKTQKEHYEALLADGEKNLNGKMALLREIEAKKRLNHPKSEILSTLFHHLNAHRIQIESLRVSGESYALDLQAVHDDDLTSFLRTLTRIGTFSVSMQTFRFDPLSKSYKSTMLIRVDA